MSRAGLKWESVYNTVLCADLLRACFISSKSRIGRGLWGFSLLQAKIFLNPLGLENN
jgi:hypothetical protein